MFTTQEQVDLEKGLRVHYDNNDYQPFKRDVLWLSVYDSLKHRKTAISDATGLTATIIYGALAIESSAVIHSTTIAKQTYTVLKRFDKLAASTYAAYHTAAL